MIFLQSRIQGDYNKITYSLKKVSPKKDTSVEHWYFIPREGTDWNPDFVRGKTFFNQKDGFLFGAIHELGKMGEIVRKPVY